MEKKKRAVFYDRVSTVNIGQDTSVENQRQLCLDFLESHPEYELAEPIDTYVERVSGKTDLRERYDAMLKRITAGEDIHYIFVKDLKRLSRSSEVSLEFKTFCKVYDIKLILLGNKGAEEYDPNAEGTRLIYSIESAINEEYVHNQSRLARLSHKQKMEAKRLNRNNVTFGYKWNADKKDIVIDEDKATVVREIFDLYVFRGLGASQIANKIAEMYGIIVTTNTVSKWLCETAYIGTFHMNKKGSILGVGHGQKTKRFTNNVSEWVPVDRPDLQIVEREIFELAQMIRKDRKVEGGKNSKGFYQARFRGTHLFSSKVYCKECGNSYIHYWCNQKKTVGAYKDSFKVKNHDPHMSCTNQNYGRIYERDLEAISLAAINGYIENYKECIPLLVEALRTAIKRSPSEENKITNLKKRLKSVSAKRNKCRERYIEEENKQMKEDLHIRYQQLVEEIEDIEKQLKALSNKEKEQEVDIVEKRMKEIESVLAELQNFQGLDRDIIEAFIKRIEVDRDGKINILLYGTGIKSFEITSWNERQADKEPASSFMPEGIEYSFNQEIYMDLLANSNNQGMGYVPLFVYVSFISNDIVSQRSDSKYMQQKKFKIFVNVYIIL